MSEAAEELEKEPDDLITIRGAMAVAGVSHGTIHNWISSGHIRGFRKDTRKVPSGFMWMVSEADLRDFLKRTEHIPARGNKRGRRLPRRVHWDPVSDEDEPREKEDLDDLLEVAETLKELASTLVKDIQALQRADEAKRRRFGQQLQGMLNTLGAADAEIK